MLFFSPPPHHGVEAVVWANLRRIGDDALHLRASECLNCFNAVGHRRCGSSAQLPGTFDSENIMHSPVKTDPVINLGEENQATCECGTEIVTVVTFNAAPAPIDVEVTVVV